MHYKTFCGTESPEYMYIQLNYIDYLVMNSSSIRLWGGERVENKINSVIITVVITS